MEQLKLTEKEDFHENGLILFVPQKRQFQQLTRNGIHFGIGRFINSPSLKYEAIKQERER